MEYTKDMILGVHYNEVHNVIKTRNRTSRFFGHIRKHKLLATAILSVIIFISIDAILITNFFRILSMI